MTRGIKIHIHIFFSESILCDLGYHIINNWSQAADQQFSQQKDGESYKFVHLIDNVQITYCADKKHTLPPGDG